LHRIALPTLEFLYSRFHLVCLVSTRQAPPLDIAIVGPPLALLNN